MFETLAAYAPAFVTEVEFYVFFAELAIDSPVDHVCLAPLVFVFVHASNPLAVAHIVDILHTTCTPARCHQRVVVSLLGFQANPAFL